MISAFTVWVILFTILALLHAAEISITTLWPWKVKEFAEEEAEQGITRGTFEILNEDITRVLTTILVTSTACSIYATTMFTQLVGSLFGHRGERFGAILLTAITLFFVELLPKSIGVNNAEKVARFMVVKRRTWFTQSPLPTWCFMVLMNRAYGMAIRLPEMKPTGDFSKRPRPFLMWF